MYMVDMYRWNILPQGSRAKHDRESRPGADPRLGNTRQVAGAGALSLFFLSHLELALTNSPVQKEHPRGGMPSCVKQSRGFGKGRESIRAMKSLVP